MPRSRAVRSGLLVLAASFFVAGRLFGGNACPQNTGSATSGASNLTKFVPTNASGTGLLVTADKALCTWSLQVTCTYDCSDCTPPGNAAKPGPVHTETVTTTVDTGNLRLGSSGADWFDAQNKMTAEAACRASVPTPTGSGCAATIPCNTPTPTPTPKGGVGGGGTGGGPNTLFVFLGLAAVWYAFGRLRRAARPQA